GHWYKRADGYVTVNGQYEGVRVSMWIASGSSVSLAAYGFLHYSFDYWIGTEGMSYNYAITFTMNEPVTETAQLRYTSWW
ncbi:MAG: hypothetical protein ACP5MU_06825, partial [Thermoplasmata archaeon]